MPSSLFADLGQPAPTARSGNRTIVLVSIAAHALAIGGGLFFSLSTTGVLPVPRQALAFVDTRRDAMAVDIHLDAESRPRTPTRVADAPAAAVAVQPFAAAPDAAPLFAPTGVAPETGAESSTGSRPAEVTGIESGAPAVPGSGLSRIDLPPAPPRQTTPVRLHSGIRAPSRLSHVDPAYPPIALRARVEGIVILEAVIDASGRVTSVQVLRSIPLLDRAAIDAVREWHYSPALLNGSPVPVIVTVTVTFKL